MALSVLLLSLSSDFLEISRVKKTSSRCSISSIVLLGFKSSSLSGVFGLYFYKKKKKEKKNIDLAGSLSLADFRL